MFLAPLVVFVDGFDQNAISFSVSYEFVFEQFFWRGPMKWVFVQTAFDEIFKI